MKTAKEILLNQKHGFDNGQFESAIKAMEEYAKQVAYDTLKSAADKYIGRPVKDSYGNICDVSNDIIYTQIFTP